MLPVLCAQRRRGASVAVPGAATGFGLTFSRARCGWSSPSYTRVGFGGGKLLLGSGNGEGSLHLSLLLGKQTHV